MSLGWTARKKKHLRSIDKVVLATYIGRGKKWRNLKNSWGKKGKKYRDQEKQQQRVGVKLESFPTAKKNGFSSWKGALKIRSEEVKGGG